MKIILFGAGIIAKNFISYCKYNVTMKDIKIVGICDNDLEKQGKRLEGYNIFSIELLNEKNCYDAIVICSNYINEITLQIQKYTSIDNIYSSEEFIRNNVLLYNIKINEKRNNNQELSECAKFDENSLVVYTAIFGDYDELKEPLLRKGNIKYICFTDNKKIESDFWDVIYVDNVSNPRLEGKKYKILPHKLFPNYSTSIWVDASFLIKDNLLKMMKEYQKSSPILLFPHYGRVCLYEEAAVCMINNLDDKQAIMQQVDKYYEEKFPQDYGLYCGGILVRKHNQPEVINVMERWYDEVVRYSVRDQISLPYVLWNCKQIIDTVPEYISHNEWVDIYKHILLM